MDIQIAKDVLQGVINTKASELEAFKLAHSILTDTFEPEFKARDQAVQQLAEKGEEIADLKEQLAVAGEAEPAGKGAPAE